MPGAAYRARVSLASEPRSALVLLDIDGTLVDSTYHHALAWQRAFRRHDLDFPFWRIHRSVGMGGDKLVGAVGGDEVEERLGDALRAAWEEEFEPLSEEVRPLPGAQDLLRDLADRAIPAALASSGERRFAEKAMQQLGAESLVEALTSSADAQESKPQPDLLAVTLEEVPARRAVLVGDTPYDIEAASRAGLACVAVRSGGFADTELAEADAIVDGPGDLVGFDWDPVLRDVGDADPRV